MHKRQRKSGDAVTRETLKALSAAVDWNSYMGSEISPEQYASRGGDKESIIKDLTDMWGQPAQGSDYMPPDEVKRVAAELAGLLPS